MSKRFYILGSGNVANHLAPALTQVGWHCAGVYSRTSDHARTLAARVTADSWSNDIGQVLHAIADDSAIDVLLISLTDNALAHVSTLLSPLTTATVLHTSGSTPMSVLDRVRSYGVLYPMQTFSRDRAVDITSIPFFIEAHDDQARAHLEQLTSDLRITQVQEISSDERIRLHMAAVFGCNFVNHLYAMADRALQGTSIPFDTLAPLLHETLHKALSHPPSTVQTGPAIRHDQLTIDRHLHALQTDPQMHDVYLLLTQSIQTFHQH